MVFQFIQDVAEAFACMSAALNPKGLLAFAVFNPDYIKCNIGADLPFQDFAATGLGQGSFCPNQTLKIPMYIRSEEEYEAIAQPLGLCRVAACRPPFTEEFLNRYPEPGINTSQPKYIIMVYQK